MRGPGKGSAYLGACVPALVTSGASDVKGDRVAKGRLEPRRWPVSAGPSSVAVGSPISKGSTLAVPVAGAQPPSG